MQHDVKLHAPSMRTADRLSLLADHMERTPMVVDMSQSATCAYGHACYVFHAALGGYDRTSANNVSHMAQILGINYNEANYIYSSSSWDRARVVQELRALAAGYRPPRIELPIACAIAGI